MPPIQSFQNYMRIAKESAWGTAPAEDATTDEVQLIAVSGATGGTFALGYRGVWTAGIAYNAAAATVQTALEGLAGIGAGQVTVTGSVGGPWKATFGGTLADTDVDELAINIALLTGGAAVPDGQVTTLVQGASGTPYRMMRTMPSGITQISERAVPTGEVLGSRDANIQKPVPGRRHSEGGVSTFWRSDIGALLMLGALGAESVDGGTVWSEPVPTATLTTRKRHRIRCNDPLALPSFTIDDFKGSQVGGVSKAYRFGGMTVDGWTLRYDATDDTGLLQVEYRFMGKSFGTVISDLVAKATVLGASGLLPVASWTPLVQEAGVNDSKILSLELAFANNAARVKSGVRSREDQDRNPGARTLTGTLVRILPDTDSEGFAQFSENSATLDMLIGIQGHTILEINGGTTYYDGLDIHMPSVMIMGFPVRSDRDGYMIETVNFTAYRNDAINGPLEMFAYNADGAY
jgi:hypothetical protein